MNNQIRAALVLIAVILVYVFCRPDGRDTPSAISFVASINNSTATLLRFKADAVLTHRPRLQQMKLADRDWRNAPAGTSELIVAFLDSRGAVIDTAAYGYPSQSHYYTDPPSANGWRGGRMDAPTDQRVFHLPVPEDAVYFGLYRNQIVEDDPRITGIPHHFVERPTPPDSLYLVKTVLRIHPLPTLQALKPRPSLLHFPGGNPPPATPAVDTTVVSHAYNSELPEEAEPPPPGAAPPVIDHYIDGGANEDCYNIVIVGDGFDSTELDDFAEWAESLANTLLETAPMDEYLGLYNVYIVRTESSKSGISCCHDDTVRDSYFGVRSQWNLDDCLSDPSWSGVLGMSEEGEHLVYDVAHETVSFYEAHLYVVLANCDTGDLGGGAADRDSYIAYLSTPTDNPQQFLDVGVHECAHVMGWLADEYIGCGHPDSDDTYWYLEPNVAYIDPAVLEPSVSPGELSDELESVPWIGEADVPDLSRRDGSGGLTYIHSVPSTAHNNVGIPEDDFLEEFPDVGLYWGCQYFNLEVDDCVGLNEWSDVRGSNFYRSMATCKMRTETCSFFCVACTAALREVLEN